jgi:hypothetical protein
VSACRSAHSIRLRTRRAALMSPYVMDSRNQARGLPTPSGVGGLGGAALTRHGHNLLLTSVAALLMASAAHARPELSKTESWKLTLGTWCVGDHPNDNEAYVGIARDQCGENEATLVIGENGYTWEREEALSCRYSSGKARFDNTIAASTKTVGVWVFHIVAGCIRKASEGAVKKYTHSFDMYVSKGTLWIENLRSDKKP